MEVVTAAIMKELESNLFNKIGVPSLVVMEQAVEGVVNMVVERYPKEKHSNVRIFCGTGNNGGDGLGVARRLHLIGYNVEVILLGEISHLKQEAVVQWQIVQNLKIGTQVCNSKEEISKILNNLKDTDLLIDGILGIGIERKLSEMLQFVISEVNENKKKYGYVVISIDVPSGVHCDNGIILGQAMVADITVTMGLPKLGLFLYPGRAFAGEVIVCDIGLPKSLIQKQEIPYHWIKGEEVGQIIPRRTQPTHKGCFGKSVIIGGWNGMVGALKLATLAAFKAGSGYVFGLTDGIGISAMMNGVPEVINEQYSEEQLLRKLNRDHVIAIGPGLGQGEVAEKLLRKVYSEAEGPIVIDADGLNLLSKWSLSEFTRISTTIITPHPLELSRLLKVPVSEILQQPVEFGLLAAEKFKAITILKVFPTVITTPAGEVYLNTNGNPGMSTAGAGDVLTGMIAGWLAQGVEPKEAVLLSVYLHGYSGDVMKEKIGEHSLMASDIIESLGQCICQIMHKF